ncbi:DUF4214 domain-containing protein [Sphingobium yanoikuyae]|uniref:DUF4214 domain-containing protein n=1 Tax=Sphingobium yanoikuyae TaxID=13690 RepID=UPI0028ACB093|nr:DUF4214 domain-containing protein [Sphingobium yanoikuyae]
MLAAETIVTELYLAFFGRAPDAGGLRYYSDQLKNTGSIEQIVQSFLHSEEFRGRYIPRPDHNADHA